MLDLSEERMTAWTRRTPDGGFLYPSRRAPGMQTESPSLVELQTSGKECQLDLGLGRSQPGRIWEAVPQLVRRGLFARPNLLFPNHRAQHLGDDYRSVGLLVVLQDRDQGSADGDGGAVERVEELGAFLAFRFVADLQPPGLVVGAV